MLGFPEQAASGAWRLTACSSSRGALSYRRVQQTAALTEAATSTTSAIFQNLLSSACSLPCVRHMLKSIFGHQSIQLSWDLHAGRLRLWRQSVACNGAELHTDHTHAHTKETRAKSHASTIDGASGDVQHAGWRWPNWNAD